MTQTGLFGTETEIPDPQPLKPSRTPHSPDSVDAFVRSLGNHSEEALRAEGITPFVLDAVMLDVAHSPVCVCPGEGLAEATDAALCDDGRYLVRHPALAHAAYMVEPEDLKVMRARWLLARDAQYGPVVRAHFSRTP